MGERDIDLYRTFGDSVSLLPVRLLPFQGRARERVGRVNGSSGRRELTWAPEDFAAVDTQRGEREILVRTGRSTTPSVYFQFGSFLSGVEGEKERVRERKRSQREVKSQREREREVRER